MWYLFLDESGDLGFDFVNKRPSNYFTISLLAMSEAASYYGIRRAIKKTLRRKVNKSGHAKEMKTELKAIETTLEVKKHFYHQVAEFRFGIYSLTLNKRRVFDRLTQEKERIYNYVARLVLDQIPFEMAQENVLLIIDRSKGKAEIEEFNQYVFSQLRGRLDPLVTLDISHLSSDEEPGLQAADLFVWGIFRGYEKNDWEWFEVFKKKVRYNKIFLK